MVTKNIQLVSRRRPLVFQTSIIKAVLSITVKIMMVKVVMKFKDSDINLLIFPTKL